MASINELCDADVRPALPTHRKRNRDDDPEKSATNTAKRHQNGNILSVRSYTVAWVCALYIELAAARAMLDEVHPDIPTPERDSNNYTLGSIQQHNVVIVCLPAAGYGNVNAASVMTNLVRTFTCIRVGLMVGIGGGAPNPRNDVRLGDIVVGTRVMPYELAKMGPGGQIQHTDVQRAPEKLLTTLLSKVRAEHEANRSRISSILEERLARMPDYHHPDLPDDLYQAAYKHDSTDAPTCSGCDQARVVARMARESLDPKIHYGGIASGEKVVKDGLAREDMARRLDAICFEMEAAGVMSIFPCLPIRGICDYSDSHKNKGWQKYAAAVAAAYARELLETLSPGPIHSDLSHELTSNQPLFSRSSDGYGTTEHALSIDKLARRRDLMASLQFGQIDLRRIGIEPAYDKTCQWFLQSSSYLKWQDPEQLPTHHGFLWIRGKPGAGKSTTMKYLYHQTRARHSREPASGLVSSFFFNARGVHLEKSVSGMYRSLILQLLEHFVDLQDVLDEPDIIPRHQVGCPEIHVLKHLLRVIISRLRHRSFTCFIDALDEGDEQQIIDMTQCFEDLAKQSMSNGIQFKVCFSSRHYPYIDVKYSVRVTLEAQAGHSHDMASYAESHLKFSVSKSLQERLVNKARGVFLWVILVVDLLNKEFRRGGFALESRLNEIPSGLSDLFKDILRRDGENMDDLLLCISWILFAIRPLSPIEFYHAMWSGLATRNRGQVDYCIPSIHGPDMEHRARLSAIHNSKGLAEITKTDKPVVQFIHESVRDFLVKDNGIAEIWPDFAEAPSHESLKQYCAFYLNQRLIGEFVETHKESSTNAAKKVTSNFPFLEYATQHVLSHAEDAAKLLSQEYFLSTFPLSHWLTLSNILEPDLFCHYHKDTRLIYVLAAKCLPGLILTRLKQEPGHERAENERYKYPLFAACAAKSTEAMYALLGSSALNPECFNTGSEGFKSLFLHSGYKTFSPFTWAASAGIEDIVSHLLSRGVNVDEFDASGRPALFYALKESHSSITDLLLQRGASVAIFNIPLDVLEAAKDRGLLKKILAVLVNCETTWESSSRLFSSREVANDPSLMDFLLDNALDSNTADAQGDIPLHIAVENGHDEIVRYVLNKGVWIDSVDQMGRTCLHLAAKHNQLSTLILCLSMGASVNATDDYGDSPLCLAVANRSVRCAALLIRSGANVNTVAKNGDTALSLAISRSYCDIANLLIDHGADISGMLLFAIQCDQVELAERMIVRRSNPNERFSNGNTGLHVALLAGNQRMARMLVDHGADLKAVNDHGETPLHVAVGGGYFGGGIYYCENAVRMLVDRGADIHSRDSDGRTPLHNAAKGGNNTALIILIERGAEIDARCFKGRTPLVEAVYRHHVPRYRSVAGGSSPPCLTMNDDLDNDHHVPLALDNLLHLGADPNARDFDGVTALTFARRQRMGGVERSLLLRGASE